MKNVVIAAYARSPFTPANKGALMTVRADDLTAQVIKAMIAKSGIDANDIEDLILGCAFPEAEQGMNIARLIVYLAELPISIAGVTLNRFCGSSMQAIHFAAGAIQMNAGEAFICAGVESMSRVPMGGYNYLPNPELYQHYPQAYINMGATAENLATKYQISRAEQEAFALLSQQKAYTAQQQGLLANEIIPVTNSKSLRIDKDSCLRPDSTADGMAELKPAFSDQGSVTAATSSPLTDGAAAVLVCSEEYADKHELEKLARIKSIAVSACQPEIMGIGPVVATQKALQRANLTLADIDIVELNEAFSAQSLAVLKELPIAAERLNIDGGAIAIGHPLGATGARITGKAASLLQRENKQYALATQCIGGGQGIATILEAI
ncbi:MAG: acetyl-CoA C-acyltransferase [Gammaproteobacteria bacterium]|nr:MAG: acetyl-CoA C-acyltransferase [Gammaproteobacteria bacterium]